MSRMTVADLNTLVSAMSAENNEIFATMQARIVQLEGQVAKLTTEKMAWVNVPTEAPAAPKKMAWVNVPTEAPAAPKKEKKAWVGVGDANQAAANEAWRARCAAARKAAMESGHRVTV